MNLEQDLTATAPRHWVTRQAIILDWDDGPRFGVCALEKPGGEIFFHVFAHPVEADQLAIRLFTISQLAVGMVDQVAALLRNFGSPLGPVWFPTWDVVDAATRNDVEGWLDALLVAARPTPLLVATMDWLHFEGCWNAEWGTAQRRLTPFPCTH